MTFHSRDMQWRADHASLLWYCYWGRHFRVWWLYDDKDRIIRAFCRYGRGADFRVLMPSGVWSIANGVRGFDQFELPAVDHALGLKPGTAQALKANAVGAPWRTNAPPPSKTNRAGRSWNQWTAGPTGPRYDDPNFDYRAHFGVIKATAPEYIWEDLWTEIRVRRHAAKQVKEAFSWEREYPDERAELLAHFNKFAERYEYMDNRRVALATNRKHMHHYRRAQARGCCGTYDTVITVNGMLFAIGFNFGH